MAEMVVNSIDDLPKAADLFCSEIGNNKVFLFYGEMGAGKTSFIKEICAKLGVKQEVTSPTFAIVNEYVAATVPLIYHFDFYRIEKKTEIFDIGFEEYLDSGALTFIEWPEKLEDLLPQEFIKVSIYVVDQSTRIIRW
jgi:tRNA threonylcarbamoyladenosine biosynthesis protein TsaE